MSSSLKDFRARALARPEVKKAYEELKEEFAFLEEVLRATPRETNGDTSENARATIRHGDT
jgi:hypothetical protein